MDKFNRIPIAEQQHILDACFEEFARNGYEQASTNAIVRKAGIPKGTLFYFFGSKKNLYLYLLDMAALRFMEGLRDTYLEPPDDIFERLLYIGRARMQIALHEPVLYQFIFKAFMHAPEEIRMEIQSRAPTYAVVSREILIKGADLSKFRDGVNIDKAIQLIQSVMEGILNRHLPALLHMNSESSLEWVESMFGEVKESFELLKRGLYQ
jgi:TetR/AcrR family transcriptional regulator